MRFKTESTQHQQNDQATVKDQRGEASNAWLEFLKGDSLPDQKHLHELHLLISLSDRGQQNNLATSIGKTAFFFDFYLQD